MRAKDLGLVSLTVIVSFLVVITLDRSWQSWNNGGKAELLLYKQGFVGEQSNVQRSDDDEEDDDDDDDAEDKSRDTTWKEMKENNANNAKDFSNNRARDEEKEDNTVDMREKQRKKVPDVDILEMSPTDGKRRSGVWDDILSDLENDAMINPVVVDDKFFQYKKNPQYLKYKNYTVDPNRDIADQEHDIFLYIEQLHVKCEGLYRMGNVKDGGWEICLDGVFAMKRPCLVYSAGINRDWTFDDGVSNQLGCEVHSFDPSIGMPPHRRSPNDLFHPIGIGGENTINSRTGWTMRTLPTIKEMLGHSGKVIDYLKLDIEGSEYDALLQALEVGFFDQVKQFSFEIHKGKPLVRYELLRAMERAGFRKYHFHPNVRTDIAVVDGVTHYNCYELYYLNTNFM